MSLGINHENWELQARVDLLEAENKDLKERLAEAHEALAGYNAQPCGPNAAYLLGYAAAGGDPKEAAKEMLERASEKRPGKAKKKDS